MQLTANGTLPSCIAPSVSVQVSYQFAYCYVATYVPSSSNNYALSVTYSGVLNTTARAFMYGNSTSQLVASTAAGTYYVVQAASGQRNYTYELLTGAGAQASQVVSLSYSITAGGDSEVYYPIPNNGVPVDSAGLGFAYSPQGIATGQASTTLAGGGRLFLQGVNVSENNGFGSTPPSSVFMTLQPYNSSVQLTANGTLPSCIAPSVSVQVSYQFAYCYVATYVPSSSNNYALSVTYSGVLNTTARAFMYGNSTSQLVASTAAGTYYVVQAASGQRNYTYELLTGAGAQASQVVSLSYSITAGGDSEVYYPIPNNGVPVGSAGPGFAYSPQGIATGQASTTLAGGGRLFLQGVNVSENNGFGSTPPSSVFMTLQPYNSSVQLTANGTLPSCIAPSVSVQVSYQFAYCYVATYVPSSSNNYALSVTYSGVLNTTARAFMYGNSTSQLVASTAAGTYYVVQAASGQRNYTYELLTGAGAQASQVVSLSYSITAGGDSEVYYPIPNNGVPVDSAGLGFAYSPQGIATGQASTTLAGGGRLFLQGVNVSENNGFGSTPPSSVFMTLQPYNSSVQLTANGTLPSCIAPSVSVQVSYQFAYCYVATYVPSSSNNYALSVTYSGVLNTTARAFMYGNSTSQLVASTAAGTYYVVQAASGQRNYTYELLTGAGAQASQVVSLSYSITAGGDSEVYYPIPNNGVPVDSAGLGFAYSPQGIATGQASTTLAGGGRLFLQGVNVSENNGFGSTPPSSVFMTLQPYNSSVQLTANGTLPSCIAPSVSVQVSYQFRLLLRGYVRPLLIQQLRPLGDLQRGTEHDGSCVHVWEFDQSAGRFHRGRYVLRGASGVWSAQLHV